jgi:myo-inositol 2-dehydrogenase/D-chiro-inositol 1-dehydrogenase
VSNQPIGIGIVGIGVMGGIHLDILERGVPGLRLAAVADVDYPVAERHGTESGVPSYLSVDELVQDPTVDAVLVATPAETHAPIIESAARAEKHILCEKPLDVNLPRIDAALRAVQTENVFLQVAFNRRFDHTFQRLQGEVAAEAIGKVISVHIVSRDPVLPGPPRKIEGLSGLFFDTTVHDFDMLRFLARSDIEMVHVQASSPIHRGPEIDTAVTLVRMQNGIAATIDNSQAAHGYDQRVEVFGSGGALFVENERLNTAAMANQGGIQTPGSPYFFPERYRQSYIQQLRAFADYINTGEGAVPAGADGRAATVAALAAQRSLEEHRPVLTNEIG